MKTEKRLFGGTPVLALMTAILFAFMPAAPAVADDVSEAQQLVVKAQFTFNNFMAANEMESFRSLLKRAQGVFIAPQVLKGAFIVGASGGSGVLLARDPKTGKWSGPAFYTIGEASFGLQIGGKSSQVVFLVMTDKGINALLSSSVKLGADIGVAVGPIGAGASAATANISADIVSFSISEGLFGGVSLDGAVVVTRDEWNKAYYGKKTSPRDILILHTVHNPQAKTLIHEVAASTGKKAKK